jgi:hypothetical protein
MQKVLSRQLQFGSSCSSVQQRKEKKSRKTTENRDSDGTERNKKWSENRTKKNSENKHEDAIKDPSLMYLLSDKGKKKKKMKVSAPASNRSGLT